MNHPELVHGLELLPCAIRDGMLYIPHADGNWVSAAKLQPFSLKIIEYWRAEQAEASRSRAASEPGEVARLAEALAEEIKTAWGRNDNVRLYNATDKLRDLASMATSPASEAQAGWVTVPREPTPEMLAAIPWPTSVTPRLGVECYRAMLASAPLPASSPVAAEGQKAVAEWYELNPPMLVLGRSYTTRGGQAVTMVSLANPGTEYESMADQHGHHRYSRSHGRIIGRCTGSPNDAPGNIVFATPTASMADAAEVVAPASEVPFGYARMHCTPDTPMGAAEYDMEMVYGECPTGAGWFPLYATPGVVEALSREQLEPLWRKHCHAIGVIAVQDFNFACAVMNACATAWGLRIAEKGGDRG